MLTILVGEREGFNEETQEFVMLGGEPLELEHSLVSLSKWESKFEKPFLDGKDKTPEEVKSYIEFMIVDPKIPRGIIDEMSQKNIEDIHDYINQKHTATWFADRPNQPRSKEIVTSELIYFWMSSLNIPFECKEWHLNRLFTLIRVANEKNTPAKKGKMTKDSLDQRRALNEARRKQLNSTG